MLNRFRQSTFAPQQAETVSNSASTLLNRCSTMSFIESDIESEHCGRGAQRAGAASAVEGERQLGTLIQLRADGKALSNFKEAT